MQMRKADSFCACQLFGSKGQFHFLGRCGVVLLHFDISLISAVWFLRHRHANQVQFNGRMQIISSEAFV